MDDTNKTNIDEKIVLSKFEGEPIPENEFERVHIHNGEIVAVEKIADGVVVETTLEKEVE